MNKTKPTTGAMTVVDEQTLINPIPERDEFADPSFIDQNARLPRIQALRGNSPETCGYFIAVNEMSKAGWINFDNIKLIKYDFEMSGKSEEGVLIQHPRMLVVPRTPLLGWDRFASDEQKQLVIVGTWQSSFKDDENIGNCQMYEVMLLDDKNQPLHQVPLAYIAKGANQATFSSEWQKFISEITACHAITNKVAARPKNTKFNALCVFALQTAREQAGTKKKSIACKVISHEVPNMQNWKNYFVGYDETLKLTTWENLQPLRPLLIPGATTAIPALPESSTEDE